MLGYYILKDAPKLLCIHKDQSQYIFNQLLLRRTFDNVFDSFFFKGFESIYTESEIEITQINLNWGFIWHDSCKTIRENGRNRLENNATNVNNIVYIDI